MVYLCHKCAGVLQGNAPSVCYRCNCISGYVRGFQKPTPVELIVSLQITELRSRLELYRSQGRADDSSPVVWAGDALHRLEFYARYGDN